MADQWFRQFRDHFDFPNNYTTIDLETTGLAQDNDLICTIGAVVVRDGAIAERKYWVLDWPGDPNVDNMWLRRRLRNVQNALNKKNQPFHHTFEYLSINGKDPQRCLTEILELIEDAESRSEVLVAHNGWWFDIEFLQAHFHNQLRIPFIFGDDAVYDSGICEKASQLDDRYEPLPREGETLKAFSQRIGSIRARGVFWALGGYCEDKYQLTHKAAARRGDLHRADVDALLLHYLVQEHRRLALSLHDEAAER
jgi:DNA polymerase III epsilon subunit-like protein